MSNAYNASDTRSLRRAAKLAKQAEVERSGVVLTLMSSPAGRAFVYERLLRCHVFTTSFAQNALTMAFSEGERNIGLQDLTDVMRFAPDQYVQMMREQSDKEQADGRRDSGRPSGSGPDDGRDDSGRADDAGVASDYDPGDPFEDV